jgi:ABC-2 type transport system permease protein
MPIFFLSGALFPLNGLPKALNILASIDPLTYGVDGLRSSLIGVAHFSLATDLGVLSLLTAGCLALGGYLFSKIQL